MMSGNPDTPDAASPRRSFLVRLFAGAASLAAAGSRPQLLGAATAADPRDDWMKALTAPHRTVFDVSAHKNGKPLALWDRYKIGQQYEVTDGETKSPALRNVFTSAHAAAATLVGPDQTIEALQQRGTRFVICMNTIGSAARKLAAAGLGSYDEIHAAILAGILPGVITVPAITVALTQLQEHGVKYEKVE
jgi:intracellular sulfur oxidation DsrE/DsrF family protein